MCLISTKKSKLSQTYVSLYVALMYIIHDMYSTYLNICLELPVVDHVLWCQYKCNIWYGTSDFRFLYFKDNILYRVLADIWKQGVQIEVS